MAGHHAGCFEVSLCETHFCFRVVQTITSSELKDCLDAEANLGKQFMRELDRINNHYHEAFIPVEGYRFIVGLLKW